MKTTLNVGLVGCADACASERAALRNDATYSVRAIFDPSRDALEKTVAEFSVPQPVRCDSFESLIDRSDVDVVILAVQPNLMQLAYAALRARKHVISEMPGTLSVDEAEKIVETAEDSGRSMAFTSSRAKSRYADVAKQYISSGRVGRIYRAEAVCHQRRGEASANAGMCLLHQILDLLQWPKAQTLGSQIFDDNLALFARADNDVALTIDVSTGNHLQPRHSLNILGDKGGLLIDESEKGRGFSFIEQVPGMCAKLSETKLLFNVEPAGAIFSGFREHLLRGSATPGVTAQQALELAIWFDLARRSTRERREVAAVPAACAS